MNPPLRQDWSDALLRWKSLGLSAALGVEFGASLGDCAPEMTAVYPRHVVGRSEAERLGGLADGKAGLPNAPVDLVHPGDFNGLPDCMPRYLPEAKLGELERATEVRYDVFPRQIAHAVRLDERKSILDEPCRRHRARGRFPRESAVSGDDRFARAVDGFPALEEVLQLAHGDTPYLPYLKLYA